MDLSVIIVSYNVRHFLEQCLASVRKAAEHNSCEVLVVDNNSADGSCSMVRMQFPEVSLIRNLNNAGFSVACNQAIRLSKGKFILLLNPDTVVEEDTFTRCLKFMKEHLDAGALGVKMINGNGKLLPESKRSLPTPVTAFFKMSGLSWLFPKSHLFNRYYLGHLDSSETTEAEIISGAFMFLRKEALEKTGLLDESFFMYGEDIDLSYRLIKEGYKNYYFPEVKIIHYKGESTRKGDINNIVHFYSAMLIFIKKHFGEKRGVPFLFFIRIAIYFWGFITLLKSLLKRFLLPITDALIICFLFIIIIPLWEKIKFGGGYSYPGIFSNTLIPVYGIVTVGSILIAGGYKAPSRIINVFKGIIIGTTIILVIYALLPQDLRFSRAIIVLGGIAALIIIPLYRILLAVAGLRMIQNPFARAKKTIIVGDEDGFNKIRKLICSGSMNSTLTGRVSIKREDLGTEVLGNLEQLPEVIRINRIDEVIFSTKELTASQIINSMQMLSDSNVTIKIAPPGEKFIVGSNSISQLKEIYPVDKPFLKYRESGKNKDKS
jgi:O-antigen biosynthesis protein